MKSMGHFSLRWWPHASEMPGVIVGALSFRQRNPYRFLIRACQVSIKEVPSPPQVSIEIELTNKNSLAALFTQSGMLLYCIFLRSISHADSMYQPRMWSDSFLTGFYVNSLSFFDTIFKVDVDILLLRPPFSRSVWTILLSAVCVYVW